MVRRFLAFISAILLAGPVVADGERPVMVGGEATLDACGGFGLVTGLDPAGDAFLAVRTGPGADNPMVDKLPMRQPLFLCDQSGQWIGVVYSVTDGRDCGISSPIATRGPYAGPCQSGWVFARYVVNIAG